MARWLIMCYLVITAVKSPGSNSTGSNAVITPVCKLYPNATDIRYVPKCAIREFPHILGWVNALLFWWCVANSVAGS